MDSTATAQLSAAIIGVVVTVLWRLVDRYLPDPNQPSGSTATPAPPPRPNLPG